MHVIEKKKLILSYALNVILFVGTLPFRILRRKRNPDLTYPKILVTRLDHIGDVILATPIFHSLKDKFPSSKIVVACGSWAEAVVRNNPSIDEVWTIDCPWWTSIRKDAVAPRDSFFQTYKRFLHRIREEQFDIYIELRGDIRHTFLFGWMPNIPMRLSNDRSGGRFLATQMEDYPVKAHEIERNYAVLRSLEPIHKYWRTEIFATAREKELFSRFPIVRPYAVFFNGGRSPLRHLPIATAIEVVRELHKQYGVQTVMTGGKEDFERADQINAAISDQKMFLNLCGILSLVEVKELIDQAGLFIGTDSSVSQIVASTRTPTISLFGPVLPEQAKPLGEEKRVIFHKFPCAPCLQTQCVVNQSWTEGACMQDIAASEVLKQAAEFLGR